MDAVGSHDVEKRDDVENKSKLLVGQEGVEDQKEKSGPEQLHQATGSSVKPNADKDERKSRQKGLGKSVGKKPIPRHSLP